MTTPREELRRKYGLTPAPEEGEEEDLHDKYGLARPREETTPVTTPPPTPSPPTSEGGGILGKIGGALKYALWDLPGSIPEVPYVDPALRRGLDEISRPFEASSESIVDLATDRRVDVSNMGEPFAYRQKAEEFRERPIGQHIGFGLALDPLTLVGGAGLAARAPRMLSRIGAKQAVRPIVERPVAAERAAGQQGLSSPPLTPDEIERLAILRRNEPTWGRTPSPRPKGPLSPEELADGITESTEDIASAKQALDEAIANGDAPEDIADLREILRDAKAELREVKKPFDIDAYNQAVARAASEDATNARLVSGFRSELEALEAKAAGQHKTLPAFLQSVEDAIPSQGVASLSPEVEKTVATLTALVREARPLSVQARRLAETERGVERSQRVAQAAALEERLRGQGVPSQEAMRRGTSQLGGDLTVPSFTPLNIQAHEIRPLFDHLANLPYQYFTRQNARVALERVLIGDIPSPSEIRLLETIFGRGLSNALLGKRPRLVRFWDQLLDIGNLPRQVLTAYDASAPFRQGVIVLPSHPKEWGTSFVTMFRALAREGAAQTVDASIKSDRNFMRFTARHPFGDQKNLFIADLSSGAGRLLEREEMVMSRLAEKIPGIRASQRAYVTFLNKLRYDVMSRIVAEWERQGIKVTSNDLDELAMFLNRATGRGSIGSLNRFSPALNAAFFAPRLLASRVQLPFSTFSSSPLVRKRAAGDLVKFVGTGTVVLTLAALAGAKVELDPRSSDFGKIRMGNTSLDFWGGYQPLARYIAQFSTGQRKTTRGARSGEIVDQPGLDTLTRFLRSKLSPLGGLGWDVLLADRKDFLGNPLFGGQRSYHGNPYGPEVSREDALKRQAFERLVPLFAQDLAEAIQDDGITGMFKALPAGLGAGATTYDREAKSGP